MIKGNNLGLFCPNGSKQNGPNGTRQRLVTNDQSYCLVSSIALSIWSLLWLSLENSPVPSVYCQCCYGYNIKRARKELARVCRLRIRTTVPLYNQTSGYVLTWPLWLNGSPEIRLRINAAALSLLDFCSPRSDASSDLQARVSNESC